MLLMLKMVGDEEGEFSLGASARHLPWSVPPPLCLAHMTDCWIRESIEDSLSLVLCLWLSN